MIDIIVKIIGSALGFIGAFISGNSKPNILKTQIMFGISNLFFIIYFAINTDLLLILWQSGFMICAIRGIALSIKNRNKSKHKTNILGSKHLNVNNPILDVRYINARNR